MYWYRSRLLLHSWPIHQRDADVILWQHFKSISLRSFRCCYNDLFKYIPQAFLWERLIRCVAIPRVKMNTLLHSGVILQELAVFKGVLAFWKCWVTQTSSQTRRVMGTCEMAKCDKTTVSRCSWLLNVRQTRHPGCAIWYVFVNC